MAGIYIPDMEMPTECPCRLVGTGYDMYCFAVSGIPARSKEYDECCKNETRASWCPLVAVPDHGDLIDRDALKKECQENAKMGIGLWVDYMDLSFAPTIIPADKEET